MLRAGGVTKMRTIPQRKFLMPQEMSFNLILPCEHARASGEVGFGAVTGRPPKGPRVCFIATEARRGAQRYGVHACMLRRVYYYHLLLFI